jgi:hypothetical protein
MAIARAGEIYLVRVAGDSTQLGSGQP